MDRIDERSTMARRFREILAALLSELPGTPTVSQIMLARRAATLAILSEFEELKLVTGQAINAADFATVSNSLRRVLLDLRGPHEKVDDMAAGLMAAALSQRRKREPTKTTARDANKPASEPPAPQKPKDESLPPQAVIALGVHL